jgi:hypothetical protein
MLGVDTMKFKTTISEDEMLEILSSDLEGLTRDIVLKNYKPIEIEFEIL